MFEFKKISRVSSGFESLRHGMVAAAYLRCEIIEKWGMIPWWLDVRVLDGYVSILKLRRLTRGVYG